MDNVNVGKEKWIEGTGITLNMELIKNGFKIRQRDITITSHIHENQTLLDSYNQSNYDITDAISKKHNESHSLDTHSNITISQPINNNILTYDSQDSKWKNKPLVSGNGNFGQSNIPFADWKNEDEITVTGLTNILATSKLFAQIYSDNEDVYIQDWEMPIISNIIPNESFNLKLKPKFGTFKGNVKINWMWS